MLKNHYILIGIHFVHLFSDSIKFWPVNFNDKEMIKDDSDAKGPMEK